MSRALSNANPLAIVKNAASGHFSAVDLDRRRVVADLGDGRYPHTARFHPDGRHAYLLYISSAHLEVVDLEKMDTVTRIDNLGTAPVGSAMTPDGEWLFVGTAADLPAADEPGVLALKIDENAVPHPVGSRAFARCAGMEIGPDGRLYVARKHDAEVAALTPEASLEPVAHYTVGDRPHDLYHVPDTTLLAVNNAGESTAAFVNTASGAVTMARTGANPHGFAIADGPGYRRALFPARDDERLAVVDIDAVAAGDPNPTETFIDVNTPAGFAATTPDGRYAIVDSYESTDVTIVDVVDLAVSNRVTVGGEPLHVVFGPEARECYVGNMATPTVAVLDTAPLLDSRPVDVTVIDRIDGLGEKPSGIFAEVDA